MRNGGVSLIAKATSKLESYFDFDNENNVLLLLFLSMFTLIFAKFEEHGILGLCRKLFDLPDVLIADKQPVTLAIRYPGHAPIFQQLKYTRDNIRPLRLS
jgi:hypothetical protein